MQGKSIAFDYDKSITYKSFIDESNQNYLFNLLLVSGYLTLDRKEVDVFGETSYYKIPNKEVMENFISIVKSV